MPSIDDSTAQPPIKLLYIGHSGSAKTGSLASLAMAGYKLRIIDADNGLDVLKHYLTHPDSLYAKNKPPGVQSYGELVKYITLTDKTGAGFAPAASTVWPRMTSLLLNWKTPEEDLGKVLSWGPDTILVIDSLSALAEAALVYHLFLNGALGKTRTSNEHRRDLGSAQDYIRQFLSMIRDDNVKCHVVLISHIQFVTELGQSPTGEEGKGQEFQGLPNAIGRALSPHIPRYFNAMLEAKREGFGAATTYSIYTQSQGVVATKSTAPLAVAKKYPAATGLADYFRAIRGTQPRDTPPIAAS